MGDRAGPQLRPLQLRPLISAARAGAPRGLSPPPASRPRSIVWTKARGAGRPETSSPLRQGLQPCLRTRSLLGPGVPTAGDDPETACSQEPVHNGNDVAQRTLELTQGATVGRWPASQEGLEAEDAYSGPPVLLDEGAADMKPTTDFLVLRKARGRGDQNGLAPTPANPGSAPALPRGRSPRQGRSYRGLPLRVPAGVPHRKVDLVRSHPRTVSGSASLGDEVLELQ